MSESAASERPARGAEELQTEAPSPGGKYAHSVEVAEFIRRAAMGHNAVETRLFARHLVPRSRVLDVGCAAGRLALGLDAAGFRVTAADLCVAMLRAASGGTSSGVAWLQADALRLPFAPRTFDAVLLLDQFIDQFHGQRTRVDLLRTAGRLLRPGGVILASTHNRIWTPGIGRLIWMAWRRGAAARARRARGGGESPSPVGASRPSPTTATGAAHTRDARARRVLATARGRIWVHRTNLARRVARRWSGGDGGVPEPGDFWVHEVSGVHSPGRMPFHHYDHVEFVSDAQRAGLRVHHCYDPLELEHQVAPPAWVRLGAPRLYWVLGLARS